MRRAGMAREPIELPLASWVSGRDSFPPCTFPLLAGREFDERDRMGAPPVAIVNEAWAKANLEGAKSRRTARHQLRAAQPSPSNGNRWPGKERAVRRPDR